MRRLLEALSSLDLAQDVGRRELVLTTIAATTGAVILGMMPQTTSNRLNRPSPAQGNLATTPQANLPPLAEAEALARNVNVGLLSSWSDVDVWPGLFIVSPNATLYATPSLHPGSKLSWPSSDLRQRLVVQRPFFIAASMAKNGETPPEEVHREVYGFCLPDSDQVAYLNRWVDRARIEVPSDSPRQTWAQDGTLIGEPVSLEPAVSRQGLTWRYLNSVYTAGNYSPYLPEVFNRVCGRSTFADPDTVNLDINAYSGAHSSLRDIITLPGAA